MRVNIQFQSKLRDYKILRNTKKYFKNHDFKLKSSKDGVLNFTKGSSLNNLVTFNPLNLKSDITIKIDNKNIDLKSEINSGEKSLNDIEAENWEKFIENYKIFVTENIDLTKKNIEDSKKATAKNIKLSIRLILLVMLFKGLVDIAKYFLDL